MKKIIIAIDGFSSTGKSTIAKKVANALGYIYVDTGAMYRAITLMAIKNNSIENEINLEKITNLLQKIKLEFKYNSDLQFSEMYCNGENVENQIRDISVSNQVSKIAKLKEVRSYLVDLQQNMGKEKGIVMDGRDIGTVVFPQAELKIFMTASEEIRAERRYKELSEKNTSITFEQVLNNIRERDFMDTHREESPLKKAVDAIELDNSFTTIDEIVLKITTLANEKIKTLI